MEKKPSGELAAKDMEKFVRNLQVGDFPFMTTLNDEAGRPTSFVDDYLSGHSLILVFVPSMKDAAARDILKGFQMLAKDFEAAKIHILIVSGTSNAAVNRAGKEALGLIFPVLSDPGNVTFAAYGLKPGGNTLRTVILTPFRQVQGILDADVKDHAKKGFEMAKDVTTFSDFTLMPPHAPVLVIPNVLEKNECQDLVKLFESQGDLTAARPRGEAAAKDYKFPVYEHDRQDRIDHVIKNEQVVGFLDQRMKSRIYPMITKAFSFEVTKHELLHVARYFGPREGTHIGHRDNTAPETKYRRFALSVSLNDDYEGGELVFREYTDRGYRGKPGTAFIFSSALLHEIMETTKGVRYNLISHFF